MSTEKEEMKIYLSELSDTETSVHSYIHNLIVKISDIFTYSYECACTVVSMMTIEKLILFIKTLMVFAFISSIIILVKMFAYIANIIRINIFHRSDILRKIVHQTVPLTSISIYEISQRMTEYLSHVIGDLVSSAVTVTDMSYNIVFYNLFMKTYHNLLPQFMINNRYVDVCYYVCAETLNIMVSRIV